jgi:glycosyltransferase involved in cell wall biosynthesis
MSELPVSVVSPVRNCVDAMPAHAAHLRSLAGMVEEIIVVDSDSTDGTLDCLKRELDGLGVVFLNHPPGLYQSWNYGISTATRKYCTIATVGDPLPAESLKRLTETIGQFEADAVISAPEMLGADGGASTRRWPIHQLIAESGMSAPRLIEPAKWLAMTLGFFPATLISSSAGNLYSTKFLQQNPFPIAYGHAGDCVWALEMGPKTRWVIDPLVKSYFWVHPISAHRHRRKEEQVRGVSEKAENCFRESESFLLSAGIPEDFVKILGDAPRQQLEKAMIQIRYDALGKSLFRRFLPEGRRLKRSRKQVEREIAHRHARTRLFARTLGSDTGGPPL